MAEGLAEGGKPCGFYSKMDDEELIVYARGEMWQNRINGMREIRRKAPGLYHTLQRRRKRRPGLIEEIGIDRKKREAKDWDGMDRGELIAYAKEFIGGRGISGREELRKEYAVLYGALTRRKLLDAVGLGYVNIRHRDWAAMDKDGLVAFAKGFIAEKGIGGREELKKADRGLYLALLRRKLLDAAFAGVEASKHADAVDGVIAALESFGDAE